MQHAAIGLGSKAIHTARGRFIAVRSHATALAMDEASALEVAAKARRVAVLGIKPESKAGQPAHDVPRYLASTGVDIIPVPVYFPEVQQILGKQVYRNLAEIPGGQLDVVNVFRRPQDIPQHMGDIIAAKPKVVWLQTGITNEAAEEKIAAQGMRVVSDRCLMVDRQRALARL